MKKILEFFFGKWCDHEFEDLSSCHSGDLWAEVTYYCKKCGKEIHIGW